MAQHSNWQCPQCGLNDIGGDRISCPRCGKKRNRWGYWDCAGCQTKSIRADHKECPNCGRPRARDVRFYLRDDRIEFVDEVSGKDAVRIRRENWICPFCSQQNDDAVQTCVYCGASRAESKERYHDVHNHPAPTPHVAYSSSYGSSEPAPFRASAPQFRTVRHLLLKFIVGLVLFAGMIFGGWWFLTRDSRNSSRIRKTQVSDAYWKNTVYLEELQTFEGNDWRMPSYGRLLRTATEDYEYVDHYEKRTRQVWVTDYPAPDYDDGGGGYDGGNDWGGGGYDGGYDGGGGGWEDYGNGQFGVFRIPFPLTLCIGQPDMITMHYETETYEEPIYATVPRTKYYYEYDAWVDGRLIVTRGNKNTQPYFKEFTLGEKERESGRTTDYFIQIQHNGGPVDLKVTQKQYDLFARCEIVAYRFDDSLDPVNPRFFLIHDGTEYECHPV